MNVIIIMLVKYKANFTAKSVSVQCTDLHTPTKLEMSYQYTIQCHIAHSNHFDA